MLKISMVNGANHDATLKLEGRIAGPWTAELNQVCERLLRENRQVNLVLADVAYLDRAAAQLLARLQSKGVVLAECSPFTAEQLRCFCGG